MPLNPLAIIVMSAGEPDHFPRGHVLVGAVDRIGEEALLRVVENLFEEILAAFVSKPEAAAQRQKLVEQYVAAFRKVEVAANSDAKATLKTLAANVSTWVTPDKQAQVSALVDGQISKLS